MMEEFTKREQAKLLKLGFSAKAIFGRSETWTVFLHSIGSFRDYPIGLGKAETRTEALKLAIKEAEDSDKCLCGGIIAFHHRVCVKCGEYCDKENKMSRKYTIPTDKENESDGIIKMSNIVVRSSPGMTACRIVIRETDQNGNNMVAVHTQFISHEVKPCFESGDYFSKSKMKLAEECFKKRVEKLAREV